MSSLWSCLWVSMNFTDIMNFMNINWHGKNPNINIDRFTTQIRELYQTYIRSRSSLINSSWLFVLVRVELTVQKTPVEIIRWDLMSMEFQLAGVIWSHGQRELPKRTGMGTTIFILLHSLPVELLSFTEKTWFVFIRFHLARRFWNHILTWTSDNDRLRAIWERSDTLRYFLVMNIFSSSSSCSEVKAVLRRFTLPAGVDGEVDSIAGLDTLSYPDRLSFLKYCCLSEDEYSSLL